jgi:hypothetical protein
MPPQSADGSESRRLGGKAHCGVGHYSASPFGGRRAVMSRDVTSPRYVQIVPPRTPSQPALRAAQSATGYRILESLIWLMASAIDMVGAVAKI